MQNNYLVIMAGGVGTRFWPFSRTNYPKQFHDVLGTGKTMLQQTSERFDGICPPENIYIVTNSDYISLIKSQLPFLSDGQILAEPTRRNTAPCIAYACYKIAAQNPLANIIVAPADHIILKEDAFRGKVTLAIEATQATQNLVTLGITPSRPDTGYGYIQFEKEDDNVAKKVVKFREKPTTEVAEAFLASGEYVWNAGIFIWTAQAIKQAFEKNSPTIAATFEAGNDQYFTATEQDFINQVYPDCESISIDYAILEKADNVSVVLGEFGWSDLGTWKSLYEVSEKDENQNALDAHVLLYDVKDCIIKTPQERLVVIQGLKGYIVAEFDNVLMICQKDQEQKVKEFVAAAGERGIEFV